MRFFYFREYVRSSLWFIPALCVTAAIALALSLVSVDRRIDSGWIERLTFRGDAENARAFLTTISSSMITFTGLVFTITIVVLQLASQQLSPRVLRTFLRDRVSQLSLGVFVATFSYAIVVLREIRSSGTGAEFVPNIAITAGFIFVLLSLGFFVAYIHHISQSIRIGSITEAIAAETTAAIAQLYEDDVAAVPRPERAPLPEGEPTQVVRSHRRGIVAAVDRAALVDTAQQCDAVIEVVPGVGDFVPRGGRLLRVFGNAVPEDEVRRHVALSKERTMEQDPAFGFRQLVDIAQKALSPGINDPTTAVQAVDSMHDLLRDLATRPFPTGQSFDDEGNLRLVYPVTTWKTYVALACDELRHYGSASLQVMRRMRAMLQDLRSIAPEDRCEPLDRQLKLLDAVVQRTWADAEDRRASVVADPQGIGH